MSKEKELKMKNKKLNVVELFSGIGSQAKALENTNINFETVNTCEWDIHALVAYDLIHNDGLLHSGSLGLTKLELLNELNKYLFDYSYNLLRKLLVLLIKRILIILFLKYYLF